MRRPAPATPPATPNPEPEPTSLPPVGADRQLVIRAAEPATLPIASLTRDPAVNCRAGGVNEKLATEYAEALTSGATLPPVVVFHADGKHWLADGWHRVRAHELAGRAEVPVNVREGDRRAALLFAAGCNANHGARRTRDDVKRAILALLADPEWETKSDRWIAEQCGCDHKTVKGARPPTGEIPQLARVGKDGKVRRAPPAGRRRPAGTTPERAAAGARRVLDRLVKFWPRGVPVSVLGNVINQWVADVKAGALAPAGRRRPAGTKNGSATTPTVSTPKGVG